MSEAIDGEELFGAQMPRLWTAPDRHREVTAGCRACRDDEYPDSGCGDYLSQDVLEWAGSIGYQIDPWQEWTLKEALGTKQNGKWSAKEVALIVSRQNGKGDLALPEPVYTTTRGWVDHGTIRVGDYVLDGEGQPTKVVYTSPVFTGRDCYRVTFADGASIIASQYHLWRVRWFGSAPWSDVSTEELARSVGSRRPSNGRMEYNWRVRADTVPDLPDADLPVDPYLLGFWLGDGTSSSAEMTIGARDLDWALPRLEAAGCEDRGWDREGEHLRAIPKGTPSTAFAVSFKLAGARMRDGFEARMRKLGIWGKKRIPEIYLTASVEQRRALLAGLMDTDGSITPNNKTPQCEFSTSIPELAEDFHRLARSLGIKTSPKWRKTAKKDSCRFLFTAPFDPFQMPRKSAVWKPPSSYRHELMSIVSIEPVESEPTRCIKVANPDGVYLTGKHFTPTHNTILEVRELGGMFVIGEGLIIHTSHEFKTSIEHFRRVREVIDNNSSLRKRVKHIAASHGDEAIELHPFPTIIFGPGGRHITKRVAPRLRFLARSRGSGRGFSCDCLVYDEAMILSDEQVGASMPTMAARANPQIWYTGSAGLRDSVQLGAVRRRIVKDARNLFGAEWSISPHNDSCPRDEIHGRETNYYIVCDKHDDRDDPRSVAKSNPALGYRISLEFTDMERAGMPPREFDRERLGVGEWPADEDAWAVISEEAWTKLVNADPGAPLTPIAFAADVDEDGHSATISAAWEKPVDGGYRTVIEIPRGCSRQGSDWVIEKLDDLYKRWHPVAISLPRNGPGAALLEDGKKRWGDRVVDLGSAEEAAAFAWFLQQVRAEAFWHFGKENAPTLWHAVGRASTRVVGDGGKAWSRRDSESDITPITSATAAAYALNKKRRSYDLMKSIA